jgi:D-beta-D-heptose 7-phosphate kinase/D-beta-D-heptose 1-phosphate adenosyltransferase
MIRSPASKILSLEEMMKERERLRREGSKLVFTNGCFDLVHPGHVEYLYFARSQGDALVVGLNADRSVRRLKGQRRPIVPEQDRARVLAALECVDYVVLFAEEEPRDLIKKLLPDILVKGEDWAHYVSGREAVEAHGGRVVLAPLVEGRSTSDLVRRIVNLERTGGNEHAD